MTPSTYVLWFVISVGANVTLQESRRPFDTKEQCDAVAGEIERSRIIQDRAALTRRGAGSFLIDHVCSFVPRRHGGAD